MRDDAVVTRDEFTDLVPVTAPEAVPPPRRRWSDDEWARICRGLRARDMDDRWLAFVENDRLFLHRSWTGIGIYEAQFVHGADGWSITELIVSGDRDSYRRSSDAYEAVLVEAVIDGVVLEKRDSDAWARLRATPRERA